MLLVNIFTATYLSYYYLWGRGKESRISKWSVLFVFSFYWIFFLLSYFLPSQDIRSIARFVIIPALAAFVLLLPFKLENRIRRVILLLLICYVLFFLCMIVWHYFSSM